MNGCDVLGQEGRKALDACVKVKIYGRPQTQLYDYNSTIERLEKCFAGKYPDGHIALYRRILKQEASNIEQALMDESIIEKMLLPSLRDNYEIIDIYESLVHLDNTPYVEKYPRGGTWVNVCWVCAASPQSTYPIIVYFSANYRAHLSHFLENVIFAIPT